jgi:serine/threonine protein kinase
MMFICPQVRVWKAVVFEDGVAIQHSVIKEQRVGPDTNPWDPRNPKREAAMMLLLENDGPYPEHCIRLEEAVQTGDTVLVILPFLDGCDLLTLIHQRGRLTVHEIKRCVRSIAAALRSLKRRRVAHNDLTCENIFVTVDVGTGENDFTLIDMGSALLMPEVGMMMMMMMMDDDDDDDDDDDESGDDVDIGDDDDDMIPLTHPPSSQVGARVHVAYIGGKMSYKAPEAFPFRDGRAREDHICPFAADVFGLGVVTFQVRSIRKVGCAQ